MSNADRQKKILRLLSVTPFSKSALSRNRAEIGPEMTEKAIAEKVRHDHFRLILAQSRLSDLIVCCQ
ncbi:hypothetical protein NLN84_20005 [Citrobacter portucalensis]|uniref:hypothetical protein n=1 Tax=Citrobacter freundii complex TaxID=1344959 RepID=UPI00226B80E5|nr:hypothetical protein [Citrobacter portucalensis]MCX9067860.1 hypothetical protein [Citrobacter portucalensis]